MDEGTGSEARKWAGGQVPPSMTILFSLPSRLLSFQFVLVISVWSRLRRHDAIYILFLFRLVNAMLLSESSLSPSVWEVQGGFGWVGGFKKLRALPNRQLL